MKANEAPEKIWIDNLDEGFWFNSPSGKKSVEYTRTDLFIEKACAWLEKHATSYIITTKIHGCNMTGLHVSLKEEAVKL